MERAYLRRKRYGPLRSRDRRIPPFLCVMCARQQSPISVRVRVGLYPCIKDALRSFRMTTGQQALWFSGIRFGHLRLVVSCRARRRDQQDQREEDYRCRPQAHCFTTRTWTPGRSGCPFVVPSAVSAPEGRPAIWMRVRLAIPVFTCTCFSSLFTTW